VANKNNEQYPSYHLHVTIKSVSFAAIIGFGGYSLYPNNSHGQEVSGLDKQHSVKLETRIEAIESKIAIISREINIVSAMLAKDNRKLIEKKVVQ